jgi:hypothetical protein
MLAKLKLLPPIDSATSFTLCFGCKVLEHQRLTFVSGGIVKVNAWLE